MKYLSPAIFISVTIVLIYFGVFSNRKTPPPNTAPNPWETKTDEQPPVAITVTPIEFGGDAKVWKFEIILDTHSGSLDQDLLAVAVLENGDGASYPPITWEGAGPGGHHREGILAFQAINPAPSFVKLKIKNLGGIPERLFAWDMR